MPIGSGYLSPGSVLKQTEYFPYSSGVAPSMYPLLSSLSIINDAHIYYVCKIASYLELILKLKVVRGGPASNTHTMDVSTLGSNHSRPALSWLSHRQQTSSCCPLRFMFKSVYGYVLHSWSTALWRLGTTHDFLNIFFFKIKVQTNTGRDW